MKTTNNKYSMNNVQEINPPAGIQVLGLKKYRLFINFCFFLVSFCLLSAAAFAQKIPLKKDTVKKTTTIDITSAYKPVLRNSVKINFSATHLTADTSRPSLTYDIPAQNLFYSYQPIPLRPLALEQDTNLNLGMRNYIKVGYGNFSTPYISAGFSFGDGRKFMANVYADYISSKGNIEYQDYSRLNLKAAGSYFIPKNEVYASANVRMRDNYLYGYDHSVYTYTKKDVRQQFQDISFKGGIRNTAMGEYGIIYNPNIEVSNFTNVNRLTETTVVVTVPVEKQFGEAFAFKVEGKADFTSYVTKGLMPNVKLNNNVFQVAPSFILSAPRFSINAGILPTWDKDNFVWLPNIFAEAQVMENVIALQAGWIGRYTKNTYRNLSEINPYLAPVTAQLNTKEIEFYGGIKLTLGKHFNVNGKAGLVTYTNLPFFINDTATDEKSFVISNEAGAKNFRVHGDISYIDQDKFTVTAGLTLNGYTDLMSNARAWNTVPMEFTSSLRWWVIKQVMLKADFYAFGPGYYVVKGNAVSGFDPGSDLSAGIEFKISKMFSAWMDVNNIFNVKYERWHNYPVYGLNLMGGIRVNF